MLYILADDIGIIRNDNDPQGFFTLDEAKGYMDIFEPVGSYILLPATPENIKFLEQKFKNQKHETN